DLKGISPDHMNMVTLPVTYDPQDAGRVLPLTKASHQVWQALRDDRPSGRAGTAGSAGTVGSTQVPAPHGREHGDRKVVRPSGSGPQASRYVRHALGQ
ncbi:hypothetical protein AB0M68_33940, partial [Streptomyces sp. NPDC051453]